MKMRAELRRITYVLWIGLVFFAACNRSQNKQNNHDGEATIAIEKQTNVPSNQWIRLPPSEFFGPSKELDRSNYVVVTAKEKEALAKLNDTEWIELKPEEADELAGQPIGGLGGKLVLLRAVSSNTPYEGFVVSW